jgi:hypothetical protein
LLQSIRNTTAAGGRQRQFLPVRPWA